MEMGTQTELWCPSWDGFSPLCFVADDRALVSSRGAPRRLKLSLSGDLRPTYYGGCKKVPHPYLGQETHGHLSLFL